MALGGGGVIDQPAVDREPVLGSRIGFHLVPGPRRLERGFQRGRIGGRELRIDFGDRDIHPRPDAVEQPMRTVRPVGGQRHAMNGSRGRDAMRKRARRRQRELPAEAIADAANPIAAHG